MKKSIIIYLFIYPIIGLFAQETNLFPKALQTKLNEGVTPQQLVKDGYPIDSLYGKDFQAGIIFYYDSVQHTGMVMSKKDIHYPYDINATKIYWNCVDTITGAKATKIGTGQDNSNKIVATRCKLYNTDEKKRMLGPADLCDLYHTGGFTEWYLPSKDELNQIYIHLAKPDRYSFLNHMYWTSSEKNNRFAWIQYFQDGGQAYYIKHYAYYVRAIHDF
jgi:hypothetical protein